MYILNWRTPVALMVSGISAWWVFSCVYRDALLWQAWEKERLCCHARESDSSPWAQAFLRVAGWTFFHAEFFRFFFRLQKACVRFTFLETYLQFKPFDAWRYRIEHSDVASWRLPRPNEPCDDCHPPRSIHASWRLKMWRASLLLWRPKWLFRPMHKIAWWSKWKYEGFQGDLWPWFYVNI